mmetsp:Transcript_65877/g.122967  ORF Transcript_65877/g.122967 Transcript_65877/m.122967 type:complete len:228 (+) Transcript_65877:247-930(+)
MAVLVIILILPFEAPSILPSEPSTAMHPVLNPLAIVRSAIAPAVHTIAVNIVILEFTLVGGAVCPKKLAYSVLQAILVLAHVASVVWPNLCTIAMLLVLRPLPLVHRPVRVVVDAMAMSLVIPPLAHVHIPICVEELPHALCLVCYPLPLISGIIWPHLNAVSIPQRSTPLALVRCAIAECVHLSPLSGAALSEGCISPVALVVESANDSNRQGADVNVFNGVAFAL